MFPSRDFPRVIAFDYQQSNQMIETGYKLLKINNRKVIKKKSSKVKKRQKVIVKIKKSRKPILKLFTPRNIQSCVHRKNAVRDFRKRKPYCIARIVYIFPIKKYND